MRATASIITTICITLTSCSYIQDHKPYSNRNIETCLIDHQCFKPELDELYIDDSLEYLYHTNIKIIAIR